MDIFELVGYRSEIAQEKMELIRNYEKALDLYSSKNFSEAKNLFSKLFDL